MTCGGGKQVRSRVKILMEHAGDPCVGDDSDERDCNIDPCKSDRATVFSYFILFTFSFFGLVCNQRTTKGML